jgi:hypothetical protein
MATVSFKRGTTSQMNNTPITDGMLFYNTENHKIFMDNGSERLQYGGDTDLISDPSEATVTNVFSATSSMNLFPLKTTVLDSKTNALAVTQEHIPLGCLAFKEMLGTNDYSSVGDGTVSGGLVSLFGERILATLPVGDTTLILNSSILTSASDVTVLTDNWQITPSNVVGDATNKTITLTFGAQSVSVGVKVIIQNL